MARIKGILAVGVILLFLGLAVSPVTSQTTIRDRLEIGTSGDLASIRLSEQDLTTMEKFLPILVEKMQTATSYSEIIDMTQSFMKEYGRHPVLVLVLNLLIKTMNFQFKIGQIRPVRINAFVMSWGYTNKLLTYRSLGIEMIRPLTAWYYSGRYDRVLGSYTIILDPYPLSIKVLTGRQIGYMTNFIGLYIHRSGINAERSMTYFIGYAKIIRGFDLSPVYS
jgi:hypothetical protein